MTAAGAAQRRMEQESEGIFLSHLSRDPVRGAGPTKAYTAREQAEMLFELAGRKPKFISVPVGLMDFIIGAMETIGKVIPSVGVRHLLF